MDIKNIVFDAEMNPIGCYENGEIVRDQVTVDPTVLAELKEKNSVVQEAWKKEQKIKDIETYIYSRYPQKKQNQDQTWATNFRTKLVAMGITDIEKKVVDGVKAFMSGTPIAEYLKDEPVETQPLFEKLIKIGIRSEWAYQCIVEGKKAIAENREPVYPKFPN